MPAALLPVKVVTIYTPCAVNLAVLWQLNLNTFYFHITLYRQITIYCFLGTVFIDGTILFLLLQEGEAKPIFIIEAYGSLLDAACIPPWKVHLVENAGYTELSSRKETKRFTHEVLAASAYIFTLPYRDRKNNVHYELLGKLIETDECKYPVSE